MLGRLAPGATRAAAQSELDAAMRELAVAFPQTNTGMRAEILSFWEAPRGPQRLLAASLAILQAITLLLLLAVCGNTANLVLARASTRRQEMAVRLALGAKPWHIGRLLLTESVLLALCGGLVGAALALWGTNALSAVPPMRVRGIPISPSDNRRWDRSRGRHPARARMRVPLWSGACPSALARRSATTPPRIDHAIQGGLRTCDGGRGRPCRRRPPRRRHVLQKLPGNAQHGSGIHARRRPACRLRSVRPATRRRIDTPVRQPVADQAERAAQPSAAPRLRRRYPLDIHGLPVRFISVEGRPRNDNAPDRALAMTVTPGYFAVMGIPLLSGTDFADLDDRTAPPQVVVNEELVRRFLDHREPLGRRVEARGRSFVIAGVARNAFYNAFGEPPTPIVYFSYRDQPSAIGEVHLRPRVGSETALAPDIRRVVSELDPNSPSCPR